ncbi:MAG: hypothetical protein QN716_01660 [Nitrososphaeraceae archaeon]|nr:hypothetical protein [Nitrososphaeraceae archaeon]
MPKPKPSRVLKAFSSMDLSEQIRQYESAEDSAIISGMPIYAGPEFNVKDSMEKEDQRLGLVEYAQEKRIMEAPGKQQYLPEDERRRIRTEVAKMVIPVRGYSPDISIEEQCDDIYNWITKPE